jgi:hypothetical protein
MSDKRYTEEFKQEAIKQITETIQLLMLPADLVSPPSVIIPDSRSMDTVPNMLPTLMINRSRSGALKQS